MDAHLAKVDQSALGSGWGAGDIMYADLDGDGKSAAVLPNWVIRVIIRLSVTTHPAINLV